MKFLTENMWLLKEVNKCNDILARELDKENLKEIKNILNHYYFKGKKLRPTITCLCSKLNGEITPNIPLLAAAVELIHIASLFHDDVADDTKIRRNEKSSKTRFGNVISIYSGDYALCQGLSIIERIGNQYIKAEYINTIQNMVRGELLAAANRFNYNINQDLYLKIISLKTASLFQLSSLLGFSFACKNDLVKNKIKEIGLSFGMAYQIMDDLEDMIGLNGKESDLNQGYFALPFILFLKRNNNDFKINGALKDPQKKEIISLLVNNGLFTEVTDKIKYYLNKSTQILHTFNNTDIIKIFIAMGDEIEKKSVIAIKNYMDYMN